MTKYAHLIKNKKKALDVFVQASNRLAQLVHDIDQELKESAKRVDGLKGQISQEEEAMNFLREQSTSTQTTLEKVSFILN